MPKVQTYGANRFTTQVSPGARASVVDSGLDDLGRGVQNLATGLENLNERVATTKAEEALNQFEREKNDLFFNPESGYFNTSGRNAYDGAGSTSAALEKLKEKYTAGLDDERARRMFDRAASNHVTRGIADVQRHASRGFEVWEVATIEAEIENALENAVLYHNDPKRLIDFRAQGELAVGKSVERTGAGAEALDEKLQNFRSSFAKGVVIAALGQTSDAADNAMTLHGHLLEPPDRVMLEGKIEAQRASEKKRADSMLAITMANNLVDTYENRADILSQVSAIEDPELQKKVRAEAISQFVQKKTAASEEAADAYKGAIDMVNNGMSATQIEADPSGVWDRMTPNQRNNILAGKHMVTDQVYLTDLLTKPKRELASVNPSDHADKLAPKDLSKLTTAVNAAKKGQSVTSITTPAQKVKNIVEQVYGKDALKSRNKTKHARANEFMQEAQDLIEATETEKGRKLLPSEMDDLLKTFTRDLVLKRSLNGIDFLMPDIELDLSNTPPSEMKAINQSIDYFRDKGMNDEDFLKDIITIRNELLSRDMPVTSQNIIRAYQQGTQ